ncbi:PREDICTED: protein LONGIFOLIA 1-like isoform X2 [Lupinus angustifolius]|uniref:protein LONGIFOLIA 1-like isoform X2 n=1 Tax=Lupinus angustifolius TaxID=3871 RepID=UPI00092E3C70|nr:PREDICTED: protein LONGIFOLIA 1-like isoform X2 [Lupinus angustifolius]
MKRGEEQHNLDKQIGCMATFLHIFDRHHILAGKRLPSPITHSSSQQPHNYIITSPPTPNTPLPLPLQFSSRLSLDTSRAMTTNCSDSLEIASEKQRPSISVVARLMGLDEPTPDSEAERSSASETGADRDYQSLPLPHHHYRFFDTSNNFRLKIKPNIASDPKQKPEAKFGGKKKSCFYDSGDFFPEKTKKTSVTVGSEIERRLKKKGIDEPYKDDLHALKQILEALQLKGLLHSNNYKSTLPIDQSPIVVMKPNKIQPNVSNSPQPSSFGSSPRRIRAEPEAIRAQLQDNGRNLRQPGNCVRRSPNRMRNVPVGSVNSMKVNMRRNVPEQQVTSRSKRSVAEEDESSTVSDTSLTTINSERYKMEEYREGRNVLERCDKLLNSIAEITTELEQPSPVSVFDSSFYKDDSPSPIIKRCIHYKGNSEDEMWSAALCYNGAQYEDSDDFHYVSEIMRACNYFPNDTNVFMLLEKQQFLKGNDTSKTSILRRRLIFDTIQEILNKNKRLPPWKAVSLVGNKLWLEFKRMRDREDEKCSEELVDVIGWILRKDMGEEVMNECPMEMGDVVLDIERLVFKDLIGEIIRDLASFKVSMFPRKFMF